MRVREAIPEDARAVRRVADVAWHDAHDDIVGSGTVEAFLDEHYDPGSLRERYRDGDGTTYVAAVDGYVVAFATGVAGSDGYTLGSIYVHPDRQGDGIGGELLDRVESAAATAGSDTINLIVMAENDDAIGFYEATGFERVDDHHDESLDVDGYVYEKSV